MKDEFDSYPIFDEQLALDLLDNDRELLREVLDVFRENTQDSLDDLHAAIESGDEMEVARMAHSIKGGAGSICAERIRAIATELESAVHDGSDELFLPLYELISREIARFLSEVEFTS